MKPHNNHTFGQKVQHVKSPNSKGIIKHLVSKFEKISLNHRLLFSLYSFPYFGVLRREINLARITSDDVVLNIGCGAMPFTALYVSKITGAQVIAIDNDPQVICQAKQTVSYWNMADRITIMFADGKDVEGIFFTKAIVALQALPKREILKNLTESNVSGATLLFRQPRNWCKNQYDDLPESSSDGFVRHLMPTFSKTLMFAVDKSHKHEEALFEDIPLIADQHNNRSA